MKGKSSSMKQEEVPLTNKEKGINHWGDHFLVSEQVRGFLPYFKKQTVMKSSSK